MKLNFLDRCWKIPQVSGFMTIRPVETELFHPNGQTHMTKLIFAFRNFAKALKIASCVFYPLSIWCSRLIGNSVSTSGFYVVELLSAFDDTLTVLLVKYDNRSVISK